jgi:hypothetical protein
MATQSIAERAIVGPESRNIITLSLARVAPLRL